MITIDEALDLIEEKQYEMIQEINHEAKMRNDWEYCFEQLNAIDIAEQIKLLTLGMEKYGHDMTHRITCDLLQDLI